MSEHDEIKAAKRRIKDAANEVAHQQTVEQLAQQELERERRQPAADYINELYERLKNVTPIKKTNDFVLFLDYSNEDNPSSSDWRMIINSAVSKEGKITITCKKSTRYATGFQGEEENFTNWGWEEKTDTYQQEFFDSNIKSILNLPTTPQKVRTQSRHNTEPSSGSRHKFPEEDKSWKFWEKHRTAIFWGGIAGLALLFKACTAEGAEIPRVENQNDGQKIEMVLER